MKVCKCTSSVRNWILINFVRVLGINEIVNEKIVGNEITSFMYRFVNVSSFMYDNNFYKTDPHV